MEEGQERAKDGTARLAVSGGLVQPGPGDCGAVWGPSEQPPKFGEKDGPLPGLVAVMSPCLLLPPRCFLYLGASFQRQRQCGLV